jgi:hypothetical protein
MRHCYVVATAHNERRHIEAFLKHYLQQGCCVCVGDDRSTDGTDDLLATWSRREGPRVYWERLPDCEADPGFSIRRCLAWKTKCMYEIGAMYVDSHYPWFLSVDIDEHLVYPGFGASSLGEALPILESLDISQVRTQWAVFVPTREEPDHDHAHFTQTMRHYYPLRMPGDGNVLFRYHPDFSFHDAGKTVMCPGNIDEHVWPLKHYYFLSLEHARAKWSRSIAREDPTGWHGLEEGSPASRCDRICLVPQIDLRVWTGRQSDMSHPYGRHLCFA